MKSFKSHFRLCLGLILCVVGIFASCKNPTSSNDNNKPGKPDIPSVTPEKQELIANVGVYSENGRKVAFANTTTNVKGETKVYVVIKDGVALEDVKVTGTFDGKKIEFADIDDNSRTAESEILQGVDATEKTVTIEVKVGDKVNNANFKIRLLDESTLRDLNLVSFKIGKINAMKIATDGGSYRLYDPSTNKMKFTAELSENIKRAVFIENGQGRDISPTQANKKAVEVEVEFAKDETKQLAFVFQAEGCKDYRIDTFVITFTNRANFAVQVNAGRTIGISDEMLFSGKVNIPQCAVAEPTITIQSSVAKSSKINKVTVDNKDVEIKKEKVGTNEETATATYTLDPPLATPKEERTVKVHVEGVSITSTGEVPSENLDFEVKFVFLQPIQAKLEINAGNGFVELKDGHRLYNQNVNIKVTADSDLDEVEVRGEDADGKIPEASIEGKVATIPIKVKDTGLELSKFKLILRAKDKANTAKPFTIRYSQTDDPMTIGGASFGVRQLQVDAAGKFKVEDGCLLMTKLKLQAWILAGRSCKDITSIKINGEEALNKTKIGDDEIIQSCTVTKNQGQGGLSVNAVFEFGGSKIVTNKVYELKIVMSGISEDDRPLTESQEIPLKFKLPDYGPKNVEFNLNGLNNADPTVCSITRHPKRTQLDYFNDYDIKTMKAFKEPTNPRATVEGFWCKFDSDANTEIKRIYADGDKTKYPSNWFTFEEGTGRDGGEYSPWCFNINFDEEGKAGQPVVIVLYVVSQDGSTNGMKEGKAYAKVFRRTYSRFGYSDAPATLASAGEFTQFMDEIKVSKAKATANGNKVKLLLGIFADDSETKYAWFDANNTPTAESKITNLEKIPATFDIDNASWLIWWKCDLDVSDLTTTGSKKTVEIPIMMEWMKYENEKFPMEKVFTRKFTVELID